MSSTGTSKNRSYLLRTCSVLRRDSHIAEQEQPQSARERRGSQLKTPGLRSILSREATISAEETLAMRLHRIEAEPIIKRHAVIVVRRNHVLLFNISPSIVCSASGPRNNGRLIFQVA